MHETMLNPPPTFALNRQSQKGQGMWNRKEKDYTMNVWEAFNGCGGWGEKRANGQKKDEGIGQSELGKMGMRGG